MAVLAVSMAVLVLRLAVSSDLAQVLVVSYWSNDVDHLVERHIWLLL